MSASGSSAALALLLDLDDFQADARRLGPSWARATLASVDELVRVECARLPGAEVRPQPPDSWLVTIRRPAADALATQAADLARRLRDAVADRTGTTASVGLSSVVHGAPATAEARRLAREALGYKTLGGAGRIHGVGQPLPFEPPDIRSPLLNLLRSGEPADAAALVHRWVAAALRHGVLPSVVFGVWLPALVLDMAGTLDPRPLPDGSPDWRRTLGHTPVAELAGIAEIHEQSHLIAWLRTCMTRLSALAGTAPPSPLIERAEQLIQRRSGNADLSLGDVAEQLSVSPFHLAHVFRRERDTTVKSYLTGLRVRGALRLLAEGEHSVGEIGRRCGFRTSRQFRATMQRETGCSPSQLLRAADRG